MRLGIISDIHSNIYALDAALAALRRLGAERVVCNGDVAFGLVTPAAAVDRVRELGIPCVRGNTDEFAAREEFQRDPEWRPAWEWMMAELGEERAAWLLALPVRRTDLDGELLQFHGTPTETDVPFIQRANFSTEERTAEEQAALLRAYPQPVVTFGHTHRASVHRVGARLLINPGSISNQAWAPDPRARFALLEGEPGAWQATLHTVAYDHERAARIAESLGLPQSAAAAGMLRHGRQA